ncbi:MAG TPA: potassium-transporting ATPase subunit KdpA [Candidatus Dormibacteraeota bacterium]|nr:potassium-transporting ATPase subunit KdpA [Candidatus Dormibacteraeota bacterium]
MGFGLTLGVLLLVLAAVWRLLGSYMAAVYTGEARWLSWLEGPIYRLLGTDPAAEQTWKRYAAATVVFSAAGVLLLYGLQRLQGVLPLNPQHLAGVAPLLALNTAVSFVTNTNWQNYLGESTMSFLTQMAGLAVQQFISAAVGIQIAIVLVRGFVRRESPTIGNFWVDLVRGVLYLLLPISLLATVVFVAQGAVQTLGGPAHIHDALNGVYQTIAVGPVASMAVIKQLGTNGGGFFNANSAYPFENPTALIGLLEIVLLLAIPVSLTYTFGKLVGSLRQGIALLATMVLLFGAILGVSLLAETGTNPALSAAGLSQQQQAGGNIQGKETRFGPALTDLFNIASTETSTGSVAGSNDSFTAIGGAGLLAGMMLGEVSPGGVGSGLYTLLLFAIVAVFIGGLMVGRTPEYLGKKIQAREVKLASIGVLMMPVTVLALAALAVAVPAGLSSVLNHGPHGFSEILYAFTSQANNNGSAFAGLNGNTPFYNLTGALAMLLGRFGIIIPVVALAGSLAAKGKVPDTLGTMRSDSPIFVGLLLGTVVLVGGLTFLPAISLGPIAEALVHHGVLFS